MASLEALWGPMTRRLLRVAVAKTTKVVHTKLIAMSRPLQSQFQHFTANAGRYGRQQLHPIALLKQQKRNPRWLSTSAVQNVNRVVRRFISTESKAARFDRSKLPVSNTSRRVAAFSGRAPFASTLRPNLTGGAMPRTAGGYSLGGGARYFSHTPIAPAQVVQNVSQAMRAFFLSGQKLRYDGVGSRGERQYRAVSSLEDEAMHKFSSIPRSAPGSFIDFQLSPTVTALSPLAAAITFQSEASGFKAEAAAAAASLNTAGFLDVLSADFGRALQDLTAIFADLRRLAILGDLPIILENHNTLRVRFPGVDVETIERLCDDIGVQRGIVGQDPAFDVAAGVAMALKFPFAPDAPKSLLHPDASVRSLEDYEFHELSEEDDDFVREAFMDEMADNPWLSDPEGYESMSPPHSLGEHCSEFDGLEGIYRFIEECDRGKGRVS
ncbi:Fc.00g066640.m01.CDS01 [Cosmosporella sp. VM-42]